MSPWLVRIAILPLSFLFWLPEVSADLIHRWSFEESAGPATAGSVIADSIGGADGVVSGNGAIFTGTAIHLPGGAGTTDAAYVNLPNGLLSNQRSVTFEAWYTVEGTQNWNRVWDFGSTSIGEYDGFGDTPSERDSFMFAANRGTSINSQRLSTRNQDALAPGDGTGPVDGSNELIDSNRTRLTSGHHVVGIWEDNGAGGGVLTLVLDGILIDRILTTFNASDINDVNNWLGRSNSVSNDYFQGDLSEFRIYNHALTDWEITLSSTLGSDLTDLDADGLWDQWETHFFGDLTHGPTEDLEPDGLSNLAEQQRSSHPNLVDTDADGLNDLVETRTGLFVSASNTGTHPSKADSDNDGLSDAAETIAIGSHPLLADSDTDGYDDGREVALRTSPNSNLSVPTLLADSAADWSETGTQGEAGWRYGYRNVAEDGLGADYHATRDFIEFAPDWWTGSRWDYPDGNPPWTDMNRDTAHPAAVSGGPIHFSIRRWTADVATLSPIAVTYEVSMTDQNCGNGVTAAVAINGRVIDSIPIDFDDTIEKTSTIHLSVAPNDHLDFIQSPVGLNGEMSDGCDGARMKLLVTAAVDSDSDGLGDAWEITHFGNLAPSSTDNPDSDGLTNAQEQRLGTDPNDDDSDDDGLLDGVETATWVYASLTDRGTNPTGSDTDGDGLSDLIEDGTGTYVSPTQTGSNPLVVDTDDDDFTDRREVIAGSSPTSSASVPANGSGLLAYWDFDDSSIPGVSLDRVADRVGYLESGASFTASAGGHSGLAGDLALDLGATSANQRMRSLSTQWLEGAAAKDVLTISFWQKLSALSNSSAFWIYAESEDRGAQAHNPWSNGTISWDTGGCCGGDVRVSAAVPETTDLTDGWHHFVFIKDHAHKQIWLDGTLLYEGINAVELPFDLSELTVGSQHGGSRSMQGQLDEFAVFADALSAGDIAQLAAGSSALAIAGIVDTDSDRLPDTWETYYGLNPAVNDAQLDPDLDGVTTFNEFRNGTNPVVNPSPFYSAGQWRVRMIRSADDIDQLDSQPRSIGVLELLDPRGHRLVTASSLSHETFIHLKEEVFHNAWAYPNLTQPFPLTGSYQADEHYALEATGQIYMRQAGDVTLGFNSDDGGGLWIDDQPVVIYNQGRGRDTSMTTLNLSAGIHDVRFVYWDGYGSAGVTLFSGKFLGALTEADQSSVDLLQAFDVHAVNTGDSDSDGMDDFKETFFFGNLSKNGSGDTDNDTLTDFDELAARTNPTVADTDGDTLLDAVEIAASSNPLEPNVSVDTDSDGFSDAEELLIGTDPLANADFPGNYVRPLLRVLHYSQDFSGLSNGTTTMPDGGQVYNLQQQVAQVEDETLRLSAEATNYARANFELPNLGDAPGLQGFKASFRYKLTSSNPAEGFSFNYGGVTSDDHAGEEGFGTGLSVEFDTRDSGVSQDPSGSGYSIAVNGVDLPGGVVPAVIPTLGVWQTAAITWNKTGPTTGLVSLTIDGTPLLTDLPTTDFAPCAASRMVFASRNAYRSEDLWIDDITVVSPADQTDSDGDNLLDAWEQAYFLNLAQTGSGNGDGDSLDNLTEQAMGTSPLSADSDLDGLSDSVETGTGVYLNPSNTGTDPSRSDTDADGLRDGREVMSGSPLTNAVRFDTDGDGRGDGHELQRHADPNNAADYPAYEPLPFYSQDHQRWIWRIEKVRLLWNRDAGGTLQNQWGQDYLFGIVVRNGSNTGSREIELGYRYDSNSGYSFYAKVHDGVIERPGGGTYWHQRWRTEAELNAALGFSGHGLDESDPLTFAVSICGEAASPHGSTLEMLLINEVSGETVAQGRLSGLAHDAIRDGTAVWLSQDEMSQPTFWAARGIRFLIGESIAEADSDDDGLSDAYETMHSLNPNSASDANLDPDLDGLTNVEEAAHGTNPHLADTDLDGAKDRFEIMRGFSPLLQSSKPPFISFAPPAMREDLNGNGLPDLWELSHGTGTLNAGADDDGDGLNNQQEGIAGTNPLDRQSQLEPDLTFTTQDVDVQWDAVPGKRYSVYVSDNLGSWDPLGPWVAAPGEEAMSTRIMGGFSGVDRKMYRVEVSTIDTDGDDVSDDAEILLGTDPTRANSAQSAETGPGGSNLSGDYVRLVQALQGQSATAGSGEISRNQAARFLMQASFGATLEEIERVISLGYQGWIQDQIHNQPAYLHEPYIAALWQDHRHGLRELPNYEKGTSGVSGRNATTPFMRGALQKPDQLRQRLAFALSQILVASRQDDNLRDRPQGICQFYDIFVRHAFGNFEDILWEVSLHPVMGQYLSHIGNQKADPAINRFPDQNYAREIMQLFTIGLWELHPNGERILDAQGEPIPTYTNETIKELARVFTGIWYGGRSWGNGGNDDSHFLQPMSMHADRHDFEAKPLFPDRGLPGRGLIEFPARPASEANGLQDIRDAVTMLFKHPNTPPFICKQLIQFLVTSNPSPAYVQRVQDVFVNDGTGARGNLGAVAEAILLDPEARELRYCLDPHYGKLKEPVLRVSALARAFNLATDEDFVWWDSDDLQGSSFQVPTLAPSVFNYFRPDYQTPGTIRENALVSPVFEIMDSYTAIAFPNYLWERMTEGFDGGAGPTDTEAFGLDYAGIAFLADDPAALADRMNLLFCGGSMSVTTRDLLISTVNQLPAEPAQERAVIAAYLTLCSPDGAILK